ncbi:hypothetical protein PENTCL1PPCAC_5038 [Pristionchus entomophagus]|uniref:Uncharacterized protein n=1 Tax=Pristionchus entomophagus TaxID=358040 RepID=A0AAV5SIF9_9BILA|nr:hypothetical protein PENTCL1PPCAC_5038 [Pristionchus entomophagus]
MFRSHLLLFSIAAASQASSYFVAIKNQCGYSVQVVAQTAVLTPYVVATLAPDEQHLGVFNADRNHQTWSFKSGFAGKTTGRFYNSGFVTETFEIDVTTGFDITMQIAPSSTVGSTITCLAADCFAPATKKKLSVPGLVNSYTLTLCPSS